MKFSCLPTVLLLSSLGSSAIFAQQPATTAQEARKTRDAEHAKSTAATNPGDPAAEPIPGAAPAPAAPAKPTGPLNFNNVPVPPPKTVKPKMKVKAKDGDSPPTIIDARNLEYSQDKSMATFTGKVRLRSVNTDIDCEELIIYFKKKPAGATPAPTDKKTAPATPGFDPNKSNKPDPLTPPPAGTTPDAGGDDDKDGSQQIEKAVAKGLGTIVTIVKRSPKDTSICKCGEATYVQETGVMVMKIFPEVYQGGKGLRANDRDTVMTLDKDNHLTATGDLKTILLNEDKKKPAKDAAADAAPGTPPAATDKPTSPNSKPPGANPKPAKPAVR